jgi:hypothetical protein
MSEFAQRIARLSPEQQARLQLHLMKHKVVSGEGQRIPSRDATGPQPLSFGQQRSWLMHQIEPESSAYNMPNAIRISGRLDVMVLRDVLKTVVDRHEVLRTTYSMRDGDPVQVVEPSRPVALSEIDLSAWPEAEREVELRRQIVSLTRLRFDLSRDLMVRAYLLHVGADENVLFLVTHHIASDGWSSTILFQEIVALYDALAAGNRAPLPDLAIQYRDFAVWQRQRLQDTVLESALRYWKQQLGGPLPVLELQADRPQPAVRTDRGARECTALRCLDISFSVIRGPFVRQFPG